LLVIRVEADVINERFGQTNSPMPKRTKFQFGGGRSQGGGINSLDGAPERRTGNDACNKYWWRTWNERPLTDNFNRYSVNALPSYTTWNLGRVSTVSGAALTLYNQLEVHRLSK